MNKRDHELDITGETCPMTFVRTKLFLEKLEDGETLTVRLREGEPTVNVPLALRDHGHEVIGPEREKDDIFILRVIKKGKNSR